MFMVTSEMMAQAASKIFLFSNLSGKIVQEYERFCFYESHTKGLYRFT